MEVSRVRWSFLSGVRDLLLEVGSNVVTRRTCERDLWIWSCEVSKVLTVSERRILLRVFDFLVG